MKGTTCLLHETARLQFETVRPPKENSIISQSIRCIDSDCNRCDGLNVNNYSITPFGILVGEHEKVILA